ncbi:hypothetical protein CRG98_048747, partial [Punica granatum]
GARTAGPSPVAAAFLPIPAAPWLTGLGPFPLLRRSSPEVGPNRPNTFQLGPASLPGGFSFGR